MPLNPAFPAVITAMDVSAGKVSSEVHAGSFCVNLLTWTHLFPNQNTGSFLLLGPNLLNSCIIETDYLCFPARQFVGYCFGGETGQTQGVVDGSHNPHALCSPRSCLPVGSKPWIMQIGASCRRKQESCPSADVCQREGMGSAVDCPASSSKKRVSPESSRKD